jgi:hypothetical protein
LLFPPAPLAPPATTSIDALYDTGPGGTYAVYTILVDVAPGDTTLRLITVEVLILLLEKLYPVLSELS